MDTRSSESGVAEVTASGATADSVGKAASLPSSVDSYASGSHIFFP